MNDRQGGIHRVVFLLILLIFCGGKASPAHDLEKPNWKFSLDLCDVPMVKVFKEVEKTSDYVFAWSADVNTDIHKEVSIHVKGVSISVVMDRVLTNSGLTYRQFDRQIVVFRPFE